MRSRKQIIAVVDDDESIRKSLMRLLVGSGFDAESFTSGAAFLASLETGSPDAVLLDMYMPDLNGLAVQAMIMASGFRIPILFITAHDDPALRALAISGGAAAYLDKPIRKEILLAALSRALGTRNPTTPKK